MKLWAIVDKDGNMCSDACGNTDDSIENAYLRLAEIKGNYYYEDVMEWWEDVAMPSGFRISTVGCYDPSTQVVIDREVYSDVCVTLKYRRPAKTVFKDCVLARVDKFLSAGEVKK